LGRLPEHYRAVIVLCDNYKSIAHEGDATNNYRRQAGDRLIVLHDPDAEAEKEPINAERGAAPAAENVTELERRLGEGERTLDKAIELLGGTGTRSSSPRGRGSDLRPREERY